ncbi:MAG: efflux RND transporter periplasmic adaptor subunit [Ardenticatenaceae bacterium]|nr:efflux RND transporter periplasmic adaptor subunit [Anaerolineales bacterium]MCB8937768.1 efflux RND transporter periplasmic adaptor subunit [Ardenticatenaceae bacterium]MCB8974337.1 efflux RND transporter periplasmic adaptor subunit [Ardenticatenaceae bacterium]
MWKRRNFWIVLIAVLILGSGGYYFYTQNLNTAATESSEEADLQTAVARVGDIVVSATGAGDVIAAQELTLGFSSSGTMVELLVDVGSKVEAGDVLARIDDTDAQQSLVNAQLQYQQAAMQTDASVTETGISYDEISVAQAQISLDEAQAALDELLNWVADSDEIALAEANVAAAEASHNAALGQASASSASIAVSGISVEQAERDLADAQGVYNTAYDPGRDWELNDPRRSDALENERERAADSLLRAQEALEIAQLNYNSTVASSSSSSVVSAQTNVLSAQQALADAQNGPTDDEIKAAQTAVRQAELSLQQALLNQEANEISLAQAELNLQIAQEAVDATVLTAPVAGTVTAVNASVGETAGSDLITLVDLSQPILEVYLDESDLNMVGTGYEVDVVFDALPDDTFTGTVIQVDPQLVSESGVTAVRALVSLNADSFAKPQTLPLGLNATVEVIGGRAEGAVLVPVEALREISDGQYSVFVMDNGEPKLRMVEVGIMDFTYAQILSGVEAGEEVTTGIIQTQSE